jgi:type IV pilus assembly protein PilX
MKHRNVHSQSGLTVVVVLVLLSIMLVGALSLARMSEIGTLAAGNVANKESSLLASEAGLTAAFNAVKLLNDTTAKEDAGGWYYATQQAVTTNGLPKVNFTAAPSFKVNDRYTVRFVVDRMCSVKDIPIGEVLRHCLVRFDAKQARNGNKADDTLKPEPAAAIQYRVTVRVTDEKGGQTWVQSLVTRGSGT